MFYAERLPILPARTRSASPAEFARQVAGRASGRGVGEGDAWATAVRPAVAKVLVYGYCVGVFRSGRMQERRQEDIGFQVLGASLVRMQFQPIFPQALPQLLQESFRFFPVLETQDEVIRVADYNHVP